MIIHLAPSAGSSHGNFELGVDLWIFVFVLDLIAALLHALIHVSLAACFRLIAAPTDREEKHRLGAAVEMLMEPHLGRHKYAARPPLDPLHRLTFLPHERVARTADDQ